MLNSNRAKRSNPGQYTSRQFIVLISAICLVLIALLFVDIGGPAPSLIFKEISNAGHIFLFFLLTWIWLEFQKPTNQSNKYKILIYLLVSGTLIGAAIEIIQLFTGRDFSLFDIIRDICGILLALAFNSKSTLSYSVKKYRIPRLIIIVFTLVVLLPLWLASADKIIQYYQYPVLSNFETPIEILRWSSNVETRVMDQSGSKVLQVTMRPRKGYSKVSLDHFYFDWSGGKLLKFDIYNTDSESHKINIRIHDNQHLLGQQDHWDRYNQKLDIEPGWNHISMSIEDIKNAPAKRNIDLKKMSNLQLFVKDLDKKWIFWIDNVALIGR